MNLPNKPVLPISKTKHLGLYKAVNDIIDYVAERDGKQEKKPRSIWDLKKEDSEEYYRIEEWGEVFEDQFNTRFDEEVREAGNAFLTREEAEAELARRKEDAKKR